MRASVALVVVATVSGCAPDYEVVDLVGGDGVLRFNLQFTNPEQVDLDLHVLTPAGDEIYYADTDDETGGELDVDCLCGSCPNGPNENIFWEYGGQAPAGDYEVSVVYYGPCEVDYPYPTSDYTLRVLESGEVLETYTGTLARLDDTDAYDHVYPVVPE